MLRRLFLPFAGLMAATYTLLDFCARTGDRLLTSALFFFDNLFPMAALAGPSPHSMAPTRDVTFLASGLHRLAQRRSCISDPEDDDEGDDEIDNGLTRTGTRLNC